LTSTFNNKYEKVVVLIESDI